MRILFDNGAGREPGQPYPGLRAVVRPLPAARPEGPDAGTSVPRAGCRAAKPNGTRGADAFTWNPSARPLDNLHGRQRRRRRRRLDRRSRLRVDAGSRRAPRPVYLSAPLNGDTTVVGSGFVTAWVKANKPSVDLQVTVSEVRPDDKETFVQGGWLRTNMRKLDKRKSTPLSPVLSLRASATAGRCRAGASPR